LLTMVYGFDLLVVCSCIAGSIARDIYGSWVGILSNGCSFGRKVDSMMMIAKVGSSEMCD
jgi:hypothetical protein